MLYRGSEHPSAEEIFSPCSSFLCGFGTEGSHFIYTLIAILCLSLRLLIAALEFMWRDPVIRVTFLTNHYYSNCACNCA
ncbi:hypothetical protein XENTR_v10004442 [Xenopus tropicalis]|nr:hypothetical protein XENTR_v10004442 [Xenopus tropicalis]